jgi:putative endonuclease
MATPRRQLGDAIEAAARDLLIRAGLDPVARNAAFRGGELDLVMRERHASTGDTLVFVEVRYRRSDAFGGGAASIDAGKQRRLLHAANAFLAAHPAFASDACRFDVVEASGDPAAPVLRWIRDAFRADDA